jgi:predicted HD superfamily hydrolase involved in NAD metabolism
MSLYSNTTSIDADVRKVSAYLEQNLSSKRRRHILGVADTAEALAGRFDYDPQKARLAGLAHDLAREWPPEAVTKEALRDGTGLSPLEEQNHVLLHGRAAAQFIRETFDVLDPEVLDAVRHHTLGTPDPSRLDLILYAADYLEPNRPFLDDRLRELRDSGDLVTLVLAVIDHLRERGRDLAEPTLAMETTLRRRAVSP